MPQVVVGLDLHLHKTQGTVMTMDGKIVEQERFSTDKEALGKFLEEVPKGTRVGPESVGFCWPWIDYIKELGGEVTLKELYEATAKRPKRLSNPTFKATVRRTLHSTSPLVSWDGRIWGGGRWDIKKSEE